MSLFIRSLMEKTIYLQKIGPLDEIILIRLQRNLQWFFKKFRVDVKISPELIKLEHEEYHDWRKQYDASRMLRRLKNTLRNGHFRLLGITSKDIYSHLFHSVFGVAYKPTMQQLLPSGQALISVARLIENFYRRPRKPSLSELRIYKEALHELGHTFGLDHCDDSCIMFFSKSLQDTDEKPAKFCPQCLEELKNYLCDIENVI